MNCTHQRKPRKARAVQWDRTNTQEVFAMLDDAHLYGADNILIRTEDCVTTMAIGDWVMVGEDGISRVYKDAVWKLKYEEIP